MKKNYQRLQIRMIPGIIALTLCMFFPVQSTNAITYDPDKVIKGERPPIDIASIPDEAIEQGIIRIKFNKTLENYLDNLMISGNPDGTVRFGIAAIDQLNQQFGVNQVDKTFAAALQNTQYSSRHRLWGFHLWYNLIVPAGTDIRSMVLAYADKNEIEVSEPVFRKRMIGAEINNINPQPADNGGAGPAGDAGLNYIPNDPRYNEQWHYHNTGQQSGTADADIDLPEAWDITKGNNSVIVAVIDQGISYTHADLAANMWPGNGYNFVNNSPTLSPGDHGTHVAGTIAANTNNGTGVSGIAGGTGTGNGVRLMSCQVFNPVSGSGGFENAAVWAADNGAAISQNSWGYTSVGVYEQAVLNSIDYFNANGGGTVLIGGITIYAAGNDGSSGQWYPGCYSGAFSVAATNNQDIKAWYSNYDTWVDIAAPGGETDVVTARGVLSTLTGNTYGFYQGTSMACPHTSGVAALIISLAPGVLTPQDVKTILSTTTDNIYPLNPTYTGKLGSGRLNAYQALLTTQGYVNPLLPAAPVSLTATAISTSQINLNWAPNAANDVVMLAWNTTNTFGVPTGNYTAGQTISGGGTILYEGTLTSFQHLMLNPATPYYYALWSKNGDYYSAVSRKANATTLCGTISSFPWNEGFENGGIIPNCWTQEQVANSGIDWTFITGSGNGHPTSAHTGTYNACLKDNTTASNLTKLITPPINLSGISNPTLTFWHTQALWSPDQDQLTVYYKTSAAGPWISLATYTTNITSWTQRSISLPAASGDYYIAFEGNAKYGYGVCVDDVSINGTASPTLIVTPANQDVSPASGSTAFTVTSNSSWTASSNQSWCTVIPSGSGNGTITATYEVNNTSSLRVANITVNVTGLSPVVVTVTQAAPSLTVSPANQSVPAPAGTTGFTVTSNTNWTAGSNQPWCTVTPSGSGNGTLTATFSGNNTTSQRIASITFTVNGLDPVEVTVTQDGLVPSLSVTPTNQNVTQVAGNTAFTVTSNSSWTAISDQTWCTVTPSGSGNGSITATYTANPTVNTRVAHVTVIVSGLPQVVVTVTQAGSEFLLTAENLIQTAPNTLEFDVYLLDADPNVPFELASIQLGFLINSEIYTGGALTASYNNTGSGLIPAQQFAAAASVVSTLTGYPNLTLLRLAGRTPPGTGNGTIISPVNPTLITHFTLTSSVPFTPGSTANLTFTSNTVSIPLYGTKVAEYISGINTQLPVTPGFNAIISENPILNGPPTLNVTPEIQNVGLNAGIFDFTVTSNAAWTAESDQPWCVVTTSGYGNGIITATFPENSGSSRTANITVSVSAEQSVTVTLVQDGVTTKTLNIIALLEGLYAGSGTMRQAADENGPHFAPGVADHITVELHNAADYSIIEHTTNGVELSVNGNASISLPAVLTGNYYVTIKHRNSIETTSSNAVSFAAPVINHAFNNPTDVFNGNLQFMVDGSYTIFGGDVNQDGVVDTADMTPVDNDSDAYMAGYIITDVNGDGGVDTADMTIVDNNSADYVESAHP
jgi:subtilisin family serine protease